MRATDAAAEFRAAGLIAALAPTRAVRSLRQGTRAQALRTARICYDHLAGRVGVDIMAAMIGRGQLDGGNGTFDPDLAHHDQRTGYGRDLDYTLTAQGQQFLADFGVQLPRRRPVIRYCIDWSEQRHHLAGALGRGLLDKLTELQWVRKTDTSRAVHVTDTGRAGLYDTFDIQLSGPSQPAR